MCGVSVKRNYKFAITNVWRITPKGEMKIKNMNKIRLYIDCIDLLVYTACRTTELNLETLIMNFMKAMNSVPR